MIAEKRWKLYTQDKEIAKQLASTLNISPIIAQLLLNRNIASIQQAVNFLDKEPEETQFQKKILESLYRMIKACIDNNKPIFIYGDYDVDGMTSTAMMVKCLTTLGGIVRYKLPHRFKDGYGLNKGIVELIKEEECGLFITLDCGITNVEEIKLIKKETHVDVIIIDHHQIPDPAPNADITFNSKNPDTPLPLQDLCTAGLVYKLVSYIQTQDSRIEEPYYLLLSAIGTVADVVKLQGENRRIVKAGLRLLYNVKNRGLLALLKEANWDKKSLSVYDVGFIIGPRLNASGRLSSAHYGVELLLTQDKNKAKEIAHYLEKINHQRRELDRDVVAESIDLVNESSTYQKQSVLVLGKHAWHAGVIGIAASKLVAEYSKPVVIVGIDHDIARGSARSMGDINIYKLLKECSHLFTSFGGHKQAAGFSLKPENFGKFKETLEKIVKTSITKDVLVDSMMLDMKLETRDISFDLIDTLETLGPFGHGNPNPIFYSDQFRVIDSKLVGNGKHLKVTLQDDQTKQCFDGIGFNLGKKLSVVYQEKTHIAYSVERNEWNNQEKIQFNIKDIK
ncbi:single-stranded-DNA-specific exonuclease RecJ [Candidatus Marinamargulisbacteria bacterium SCGC AG-333-B06]|nr:single-stranded-DNA-specific exonuclease RecJ [Candidatus Marinamargulisbacteria bacterium SCGC AG-333-B06]